MEARVRRSNLGRVARLPLWPRDSRPLGGIDTRTVAEGRCSCGSLRFRKRELQSSPAVHTWLFVGEPAPAITLPARICGREGPQKAVGVWPIVFAEDVAGAVSIVEKELL